MVMVRWMLMRLIQGARPVFDTGEGRYSSISGTYNGTIKTDQTINVNKLYCPGTGGHTEYVRIWKLFVGRR